MIREHTMASMAALGGPVAWGLDLLASYGLVLHSRAEHAQPQVHVVTLAATAIVALFGLFAWRALRASHGQSPGWRFVAHSSMILNLTFLALIAATTLLRLAGAV